MKKNVFVLALFCIVSMMANAEVAKYCMSYDDFMEQLLTNDAPLLERYKSVKAKHNRQSAANTLPILMEKGLVESAAN